MGCHEHVWSLAFLGRCSLFHDAIKRLRIRGYRRAKSRMCCHKAECAARFVLIIPDLNVTLPDRQRSGLRRPAMQALFWRALIGLLTFDLFFARNFRRLYSCVHNWKVSIHTPPPNAIDRVCNAINLACIWYPKDAFCLQRSAVTTCLLRSCGVPAHLVLGAAKLPFRAHAWVEVNGEAINERFDVQSVFEIWDRC